MTGRVSVVIPWRYDWCQHRTRALDWVMGWWSRNHPDYEVVLGIVSRDIEWVKAVAVARGLDEATGDVVIVADADVWTLGVPAAVAAVRAGATWATPHGHVRRLTEPATAELYRTGRPPRGVEHLVQARTYIGVATGGMVVAPRWVHEEAPLDPGFVGWGQEDEAQERAWTLLHGPGWRDTREPLWHLWHPPQPRTGVQGVAKWGSPESRAWYARYADCRNAEQMRTLMATVRSDLQWAVDSAPESLSGAPG